MWDFLHADVANDAIEAFAAPEGGEKAFRVGKARRLEILPGKIKPQRVEHGLVVVDHGNAGHDLATGNVRRTAPPDAASSTHSLPPCASTMVRHNGKPMPRPSALVVDKGRKAFSTRGGEKPGPESATRTS